MTEAEVTVLRWNAGVAELRCDVPAVAKVRSEMLKSLTMVVKKQEGGNR